MTRPDYAAHDAAFAVQLAALKQTLADLEQLDREQAALDRAFFAEMRDALA